MPFVENRFKGARRITTYLLMFAFISDPPNTLDETRWTLVVFLRQSTLKSRPESYSNSFFAIYYFLYIFLFRAKRTLERWKNDAKSSIVPHFKSAHFWNQNDAYLNVTMVVVVVVVVNVVNTIAILAWRRWFHRRIERE